MRAVFSLRTGLYLLYGITLTLLLLYLRFPGEKFTSYCERKVTELLPRSTCSIGTIRYEFPNHLRFTGVRITDTDNEQLLHLDTLDVSPRPMAFWRAFELQSRLSGGTVSLVADLDWGKSSFQLTGIKVDGVDLGDLLEKRSGLPRKFTGQLSLSGGYSGNFSEPFAGVGKGEFSLAQSSIELLQPILSLNQVSFASVGAKWQYQGGLLSLADGSYDGEQIRGNFTGRVRLKPDFSGSVLELTGHLDPRAEFLQNNPREQTLVKRLMKRYKMKVLPYVIGGTVERPTFRFST